MEEKLITFETAKLAKEKGFDKEKSCTYFYIKPKSFVYGIDEKGRHYQIKNIPKKAYKIGENRVANINNVILAPTQSLLQKWLREEKSIDIFIQRGPNHTKYEYLIEDENQDLIHEAIECFNTYEEALEEGLKVALNLI